MRALLRFAEVQHRGLRKSEEAEGFLRRALATYAPTDAARLAALCPLANLLATIPQNERCAAARASKPATHLVYALCDAMTRAS